MPIKTREDVDAVLGHFRAEPGGSVSLTDGLVRLSSELHVRSAMRNDADPLLAAVRRLTAAHSTLVTILERSEWQKGAAQSGHLDHTLWMFFSSCDVEHYFVALRSLFDELAIVCGRASVRSDQCPASFNELLSWCDNQHRSRRLLGPELFALITDCRWFHGIRDTRDGIIHYGALTLAIPSFETISFKVHAGHRSSVVPAELMTNEHVADFELFMAWTLGSLELTFHRLGQHLLQREFGGGTLEVFSSRYGYGVLLGYLRRLQERLPSAAS